jgi:hypothetical protein
MLATGRRNTQHNGIQQNDTSHNDTLQVTCHCIGTLGASVAMRPIMLSVLMLRAFTMSVIKPNVIYA